MNLYGYVVVLVVILYTSANNNIGNCVFFYHFFLLTHALYVNTSLRDIKTYFSVIIAMRTPDIMKIKILIEDIF